MSDDVRRIVEHEARRFETDLHAMAREEPPDPVPSLSAEERQAALEELVYLVREEYPDRPLAEIAAIWGEGTPEGLAALERLDRGVS